MEPQEEERLKKQAGYFTWMLDEYIGNAYISDMETYELLHLNKSACKTLRQPLHKLVGRKCYEMIQGRTTPCPFCTNDRLTEGEFYEWEFYNEVLDRTFLIKNRVVDWDGHRARLELSHDNYSVEYKLEKKDREREAILRTIPGGFARLDAEDMETILWYGGGFLDLLGYTPEQFAKEIQFKCSKYVPLEDMLRAKEMMDRAKDTGEDSIMEARFFARDGSVKILTTTFSYVSAEDSWDGVASFYSIGIDITQEREEQERQRKALEDAFHAARVASAAKTNFLSSMSHDIRTPMNAIMGMAAIAQLNLDTPEKVQDCLSKIGTSSRHLLSLINEVLDMSRIESGKIDLALDQVCLPDLIQCVHDMCRPLYMEKCQKLQISIGPMQHKTVITDGDRLQQILMNILSNAIKYTPEYGEICLRVNELPLQGSEKSRYEFVCIDNGIGISKDFMPLIFEPFSRAEDPRISKLQGTGLGMTITENIVHMMNGTIEVESEIGKGSRFTVSIPLAPCTEIMPPQNGEDSPVQKKHGACLTGRRILLAEDNELNKEIAVELLHMEGVTVDWAGNGLQALEQFERSQPGTYDAILMDIQMPVMNGYDAATAIRALSRDDAKTIPIIALTADAFVADVMRSRSVGMNDHIAKPIDVNRLLEVLQTWIG